MNSDVKSKYSSGTGSAGLRISAKCRISSAYGKNITWKPLGSSSPLEDANPFCNVWQKGQCSANGKMRREGHLPVEPKQPISEQYSVLRLVYIWRFCPFRPLGPRDVRRANS